jgi:hypothetical protein
MRPNSNHILGTRTNDIHWRDNFEEVTTCANGPLLFLAETEFPASRADVTVTVLSLPTVATRRRNPRHYQCKFTLAVHLGCTERPTWCGTARARLGIAQGDKVNVWGRRYFTPTASLRCRVVTPIQARKLPQTNAALLTFQAWWDSFYVLRRVHLRWDVRGKQHEWEGRGTCIAYWEESQKERDH